MYDKYDNLIRNKGIASLTSKDNPDYEIWVRNNYDFLKNYSDNDKELIYLNSLMDAKYGEGAHDRVRPENRGAFIEDEVWGSFIGDNFKDDKNFNSLNILTSEGKRHLISSGYLTPAELSIETQRRIDEAKAAASATTSGGIEYGDSWYHNLAEFVVEGIINTQDPGGAAGVSAASLTAQSVKIIEEDTEQHLLDKQDKLLEKELELDKNRMIGDTEDLYNQHYYTLTGKSDEDITSEFDKIGSGYDITIQDENLGGPAVYHMPGSNYYNTFKDTKYLNDLSVEQKRKYLAQYYAIAEKYGIENANYYLDSTLQNLIAEKQTWWDATLNTVSGVLKDIPAALMQTVLTSYGLFRYGIFGEEGDFAKYLQGIDPEDGKRIRDGFNIDYWSKAQQYDTWNSNLIAEAERNGGVSETRTVWTKDQELDWLSAKTIADVGEQAVWLATTILTTKGTNLVGKGTNKLLGKAVNAATKVAKTEETIAKIDKAADIVKGIGRYTKLGVDAAPIAVTEAQGAFHEALEENLGKIDLMVEETAEARTIAALNEQFHRDNIKRRADKLWNEFLDANPTIPIESVDYNTFLKQAEEEYRYILKSNYIKEESKNFEEERDEAANAAVDTFGTTLVLSTIKTAGTNIGLKHFLYGAPFRRNFNINSPNIATKINKKGLLEVVEPSKYSKYVSPIVRNTLGEAFDEFMDTEIAAIGVGYGTGKFDYYLNSGGDNDSFDSVVAGLSGSLTRGVENLTDENSYREAFLGLVAGGGNVLPTFRLSKPKKGSTFLEKIDHYLMNPVLRDIVESKQEKIRMQKKVDEINKVLQNYSPIIESAGNIMQAASDLQKATMAGYDVGMKSSKSDLGVTLMLSLDNIENDEAISSANNGSQDNPVSVESLVKQTLQTIERAAQGQITEEEVQDFFNQTVNRDLRGKMTTEEAKKRIQDNAKELLEIRKSIKRIKRELSYDSRFEALDPAAQDAVIRNVLKTKNYTERAEQIKRSLGITGGGERKVVAGSKKDYQLKRDSLEKAIKTLQEKKELILSNSKKENKSLDITSRKSKKGLLKEIDRSIAKLKKDLQLLDDNKFDESGHRELMSVNEILNLDSNSLAYMLDPKHSTFFSTEQQAIIEEVRAKLEDTISKSDDLSYFPTVDNPSYYTKVVADLENGAEITDRYTNSFLKYGYESKAIDTHIKEEELIMNEAQKEAAWFNHFDSILYTPDGTLIDDQNKVLNILTFADPEYVEKYGKYRGLDVTKALQRSKVWKQFLDVIGAQETSLDNKKEVISIVKSVLENDLSISDEKSFNKAIEDISNNFSPEINKALKDFLSGLKEAKKQSETTVRRDKEKEKREREEKERLERERKEREKKNKEKTKEDELDPNDEGVTFDENSLEDIESDEETVEEKEEITENEVIETKNSQADTSLEEQANESKLEEVKVTTVNDPSILAPIEDSMLPDEEPEVKVESSEQQGNTHYRYEGSAARNGVITERQGKTEGDTTNSVFEWLDINKVKLQEIIDNELADIAKTNPDVHFMMLTSSQYGEGFSLNNVVFQVVKYTKDIEKIHNKDRGGVIESNGEKYLIIGTAGSMSGNEVSNNYYLSLLSKLKQGRKNHSGPYYVSDSYTKIKKIEAGWVINSIGETASRDRTLDELFDDPISNPHGLSLKRSKWLIQENTKIVTVRVKDSDTVHSPIDVKGNSGGIFLLVPAANGHLIPISVKPKLLHEIEEVCALRDRISATIAGLTSKTFEARLAAKRELSKLLVISKEGEGVFLSKDENKVVITYMGGKGSITINLKDVDATAQLEKAFFSKEAGFKLNLSEAVLGQNIEDYIEAKALITDVSILGTANASYTTYAVGPEGEPIIEEVVEPQSNNNKVETSDYLSSRDTVLYLEKEYTERDGDFYDANGRKISDVNLIKEIKTAKWLAKHPNITPVRSDSRVSIYILSNNVNDPKVVRVYKDTGKISIMTKKAAILEITQQKEITAKEEREKAAKHKLESLEALEEEETEVVTPKEEEKTVDDLVDDLLFGESETETEIQEKQESTEEESTEIPIETRDNSILSDGTVNTSTESKMRTADFFGSEHITEEYLEILDSKRLADLQGEKLESKLRELGISEFIDPNNKEEVENIFDNLRNCH